MTAARPLIAAHGVSVLFDGRVRALDDVSLAVRSGDILGLVGESGSGKTTLCRVLTGLTRPDAGRVEVEGEDLRLRLKRDRLAFRRQVQMLLQDAAASLSPRMRIRALAEEPLRIHGLSLADGRVRLAELMARLGLPESVLAKYPHQVSGGQARRVAILRALVLGPDLVVADEPTAGLDVSVQGELLNLLLDLHGEFGLTYLIVSHNLSVVRRITSRTAVMYLGEIVEDAPTVAAFGQPAHPYAAALLSTTSSVDPARRRDRVVLRGEIPSPAAPPAGCRFHTRCVQVRPRCRTLHPALRPLATGGAVRCHYPLGRPEMAIDAEPSEAGR